MGGAAVNMDIYKLRGHRFDTYSRKSKIVKNGVSESKFLIRDGFMKLYTRSAR